MNRPVTRATYVDYVRRFNEGMAGMTGLSSGSWIKDCSECPAGIDYADDSNGGDGESWIVCESYFSWRACEVCGDTDGGNRTDSHAIYGDGLPDVGGADMVHLSVCDDCVYYAEYGRLDDQTMIEIEESGDPLVPVEILGRENAYRPYLIEGETAGVYYVDIDGLRNDGRIRERYNPDDWTAGDYTFSEDDQTLRVTGNGEILWRVSQAPGAGSVYS